MPAYEMCTSGGGCENIQFSYMHHMLTYILIITETEGKTLHILWTSSGSYLYRSTCQIAGNGMNVLTYLSIQLSIGTCIAFDDFKLIFQTH